MVGSHAVPREHSSGRGEECTCVESAAVLTASEGFAPCPSATLPVLPPPRSVLLGTEAPAEGP